MIKLLGSDALASAHLMFMLFYSVFHSGINKNNILFLIIICYFPPQ